MPWDDVSEDSTYQTMSDVLTTLTFVLMLIMVTSVMLPEEVLVPEEAKAPEDTVWRQLVYTADEASVVLDGVTYPDLATAFATVDADDYVSVDANGITSGQSSFSLLQAVQFAGLKHVYLAKSVGDNHDQ